MQKGFQKEYGSVSTRNKGAGGSHSYWKRRVELAKIVADWEAKKKADLDRKRKTKNRIERLQMIKELAEL
jgi:hypothetical protein